MTASRPGHSDLAEALRYRVLEGPGVSDRATRKAAAERASGGRAIAASYDDLVRQIGELSHRVTTPQVERLVSEVEARKPRLRSSWPRRWAPVSCVGGRR